MYIVVIGGMFCGVADTPEKALLLAEDNAANEYTTEGMIDEGIKVYSADECENLEVNAGLSIRRR